MFGTEMAQNQGRSFSLCSAKLGHTEASQGPGTLGQLRDNTLGTSRAILIGTDPGKDPALAKPPQVPLKAEARNMGAEKGEKQGRSSRQPQKRGIARRVLWKLLEII
jgi:hypothetical protein